MLGATNTAACPVGGAPIGSAAECAAAAENQTLVSGMTFKGAETDGSMPPGCYMYQRGSAAQDGIVFNAHPTGARNSYSRPLCYVGTGPPTTVLGTAAPTRGPTLPGAVPVLRPFHLLAGRRPGVLCRVDRRVCVRSGWRCELPGGAGCRHNGGGVPERSDRARNLGAEREQRPLSARVLWTWHCLPRGERPLRILQRALVWSRRGGC